MPLLPTMNSPPDSLLSSPAASVSAASVSASARRDQACGGSGSGPGRMPPSTSHPKPYEFGRRDDASFEMDCDSSSIQRRIGPPSPSSTGSTIAVGTASDAAIIQSIEQGDFAPGEDDTRSLTESIRQHIVDGGLRYHAYHAGKYCFPNDETEQHRDDLKHNLTVYLCDGEFFYAPVRRQLEQGAEVLDLGESVSCCIINGVQL